VKSTEVASGGRGFVRDATSSLRRFAARRFAAGVRRSGCGSVRGMRIAGEKGRGFYQPLWTEQFRRKRAAMDRVAARCHVCGKAALYRVGTKGACSAHRHSLAKTT
jgi:hypothetical protein